jgi:hypothetical protein
VGYPVICCRASTAAAVVRRSGGSLTTESVEGSALSFESVDDVHGGDGLSLGVLGVGDGVSDDVLEEYFEDSTGLLVDETGDTLHTASTSQPTDGRLGDSLDVVSQHFPVPLRSPLPESLPSLPSASHPDKV